jgi:transglutaminase-like putative cysteine protease
MQRGLPDLETAIANSQLFDHEHIDWARIQRSVYLVHQHLCYEYPGPINDLRQRLMILPAQRYVDQRLLEHRLSISEPSVQTVYCSDAFGNSEINISVPFVERAINFEAWILVERWPGSHLNVVPAIRPGDESYLLPTTLTQPDAELREVAAQLAAGPEQGLALAQLINSWVYQNMRYAHDVTDIHTTAAQALALKQGVCQDYAHIMLVLCRLCGLPARYVSGHLLGEGGTHAWVEVILPADGAPGAASIKPFDPTHGRQAGMGYVTIAVGRDYFDVAPTSGTFRAAYPGLLSVRKRVGLAMYEYAADLRPRA